MTTTAKKPDTQPATADPAQSLISQAMELRNEWDDNYANDSRKSHANEVGRYVALLSRNDHPREEDAHDLAQTLFDLEIDADMAERDIKIIKRARRFEHLHDEKIAANKAYITAGAELRALVKRCEQEVEEAQRKRNNASGHNSQCSEANSDLIHLRRQRPLLFTEGSDLRVRLLDQIPVE